MNQLETIIWYILGYATMPTIFVIGFFATAFVWCFLEDRLKKNSSKK